MSKNIIRKQNKKKIPKVAKKTTKRNIGLSKRKNSHLEYEGIYRAASKKFGFVTLTKCLSTGEDVSNFEEIYVNVDDSLDAMSDDKVVVTIIDGKNSGKNREGRITKIIERNRDTVIGIFEPNKGYGFVTPISKKIPFDIHIEKKYFGKAVKDSIVEVKLLAKKNTRDNPEGIILNVIGHKDDPNAEITAIVKDFNIKDVFDDATVKEADRVAVAIDVCDKKGRKDLTALPFITIDGEDTKDIDDAICLKTLSNGNKVLYVSIADVAHYVTEGSNLDEEALIRGNSVYLLDRVIPMLPHVLSNGMCSLNEGVERLTMTCEMEFNEKGKIVRHDIYESVINSHKRMSYNEVQGIIDDKTDEKSHLNNEINIMLKDMLLLSRKIRKLRDQRGAINFNLKETYIEVDENLTPISIKEKLRLEANDIIEDFMISANETVAEDFNKRGVPFLYRTHEPCDDEKIKNLMITLSAFSIPFSYKKEISPKDIKKLLEEVEGKPYQEVVEKLTLRSMNQAKYTKKLIGHFALASKYYSHFTSPIRRYSDLQIHRIMKEIFHGEFDEKRYNHYDNILDSVALGISKTERTAIDCERDIDDLKKCEYMKNYLGEEFEGTISGLTNFGIFVELQNTIEGMIPLRSLTDDHYIFDEEKFQVVGKKTKKVFTFGQKLKVLVAKCTPEIRAIDFELIN